MGVGVAMIVITLAVGVVTTALTASDRSEAATLRLQAGATSARRTAGNKA
jgi:hypothetical protein